MQSKRKNQNQGLEQAFPQCVHKYPKFCTGKRNTDIEAMSEALHKRADDKLNGANTREDHCKKKKRSRVEAVLMNIRNRNKTETGRARAKAMSGRKVEINKSDGVKVTDAKVTV